VALAFGRNAEGQCRVPRLAPGKHYVAAAAGWFHTLLLRSDGAVVAFGEDENGQCWVPRLEPGVRYTAAAAGMAHSVLLRSDGVALAFGRDDGDGRCRVPRPEDPGLRYTAVAAGRYHTVLVRSDGAAVAFGRDMVDGRCQVPPLPSSEVRYTTAAAGWKHSVLLRSDGKAVAFGASEHPALGLSGDESDSSCWVPPLPLGLRYTSGAEEPPAAEEADAAPPPTGLYLLGEDRGGRVSLWQALEGGAWERSQEPAPKLPVRAKAPFVLEDAVEVEHHMEAVAARACRRHLARNPPPRPVQLRARA